MAARLEVITGPMFSGKSELLIGRCHRAELGNQKVLKIKPSTDNYPGEIVARRKNLKSAGRESETFAKTESRPVANEKDLKELVDQIKPRVLAIDEVQFFDFWLVDFIDRLLQENARKSFKIIVAGLDMDAWGRGFKIMPELMARADEVLKLTAICIDCPHGNTDKATMTFKKGGSAEQIEPVNPNDAKMIYEAKCRACWKPPKAR